MSSVEAWMADLGSPAPTAVDVAVHFALQLGIPSWAVRAREGMLQIAKLVVALDAHLRVQREATYQARVSLANVHRACQDSAYTNVIALERLSQQEPLVKAAVAFCSGDGDERDLREAHEQYQQHVLARQS